MDLHIDFEYPAENVALIRLIGELDVYTSARLREHVIEVINAGYYRLVVDLARVFSIDSTGIGVLVGALKRCRAHDGYVAIVLATEGVAAKFRITGHYKIYPIFDDPDNAVAALTAETPPDCGFHPDLDHFNWVPYRSVLEGGS